MDVELARKYLYGPVNLTIFAIYSIFCNLFVELKSFLFTHKMFYHLKILLDIVDIYCNKRALFYMTNIFLKIFILSWLNRITILCLYANNIFSSF